MKTSITFVAVLTGTVIASPAAMPQLPNFDAVELAPTVALVGPPLQASNQTDVYPSASAVSAAAASVTPSFNSTDLAERGVIMNILNDLWGKKTTTTKSSAKPSVTPVPSSSISNTPTTTTSSVTECPTTPEEERIVSGFINPEDPCAPQPDGYGPKTTPDTIEAFQSYAPFHKSAQSAVTPNGYENTFKDLNASVSANSYLGLHTLRTYDTIRCSQWCDNTTLCTGFNIYIERDPLLNPTSGDPSKGEYCPLPSSITNYKCTLWGSGVDAAAATNFGGYRGDFQVVIVGSNGYEKTKTTTPAGCSGFKPPEPCYGAAINKPTCALGSKFFPGPFNPAVCASFASAQTAANRNAVGKGKNYLPCNFFNAYMMKLNGKAMGTYCSLYTEVVDNSFATYKGGWSGKNLFQLESSWSYEAEVQDDGVKA